MANVEIVTTGEIAPSESPRTTLPDSSPETFRSFSNSPRTGSLSTIFFVFEKVFVTRSTSVIQRFDWVKSRPLPSERTLTERYGVSRVTLRRALGELGSRGLLAAEG